MKYIPTTSTSAAHYFAIEEYIMRTPTFKDEYFMFWRTNPTLMIGRFQNTLEEINSEFATKNNLEIVRRNSGGGTIYTDLEGWQFSFITHKDGRGFEDFTKPVIDALRELGIETTLSGRNDLLANGKKFSGNARYIYKNRLLHHGSMLYNTSIDNMVKALQVGEEKLISKSIKSVRERVTNLKPLMPNIIDSEDFGKSLTEIVGKGMPQISLTEKDIIEIEKIEKEKFNTWDWNYGKSPAFKYSNGKRFKGGFFRIDINVDKGLITECRINGDFFANGNIDTLCKALKNTPYKKDDIRKVLEQNNADNLIHDIEQHEILSCFVL